MEIELEKPLSSLVHGEVINLVVRPVWVGEKSSLACSNVHGFSLLTDIILPNMQGRPFLRVELSSKATVCGFAKPTQLLSLGTQPSEIGISTTCVKLVLVLDVFPLVLRNVVSKHRFTMMPTRLLPVAAAEWEKSDPWGYQ